MPSSTVHKPPPGQHTRSPLHTQPNAARPPPLRAQPHRAQCQVQVGSTCSRLNSPRLPPPPTPTLTQAYGVELGAKMCKTLLASGIPGLHMYSLNMEKTALAILERVGFIDTTKVRTRPARRGPGGPRVPSPPTTGRVEGRAGGLRSPPHVAAGGGGGGWMRSQWGAAGAVGPASEGVCFAGGPGPTTLPLPQPPWHRTHARHHAALPPQVPRLVPWGLVPVASSGIRKAEGVRPVFWNNRPKSYVWRTRKSTGFPSARCVREKLPPWGRLLGGRL